MADPPMSDFAISFNARTLTASFTVAKGLNDKLRLSEPNNSMALSLHESLLPFLQVNDTTLVMLNFVKVDIKPAEPPQTPTGLILPNNKLIKPN